MTDRTVKLVSGYLPNVDYPNRTAQDMGLPFRFAVVLDTYRESKKDMIFDAELFFALFDRIIGNIPHDALVIQFDEQSKIHFNFLSDAKEHVHRQPDEDREPFGRATLFRHGTPTCLIEAELYTMVGGPPPYSDSYTFSIYRDSDDTSRLIQECRSVCADHRAEIVDELQGEHKPKLSIWERIIHSMR